MKKILIILFATILCSCGKRITCGKFRYNYVLNNESNYVLMIEANSYDSSFPNTLTLNSGDSFSRATRYSTVAIPSNLLRITFDGKYTIGQNSFAKHRNPLDINNYNAIKRGKWLVIPTYTFTMTLHCASI